MQENSGKPKRGKLPLIIIAIVLVLGIAAGSVIVFSGLLDGTPFSITKTPPEPLILEGDIYAVNVDTHSEDTTAEGFNTYYNNALNYAARSGLNTVIYNAMETGHIFWRDKTLPMAEAVTQDDTLFDKSFDPLGLLLEKAKLSNIQVWVRVDIGNAMEADSANAKDMREALARLPQHYGIAGVVLDGFGIEAEKVSPTVAGIVSDFAEYEAGVAIAVVDADIAAALQNEVGADFALVNISSGEGYIDKLETLDQTGSFVLAPATDDDAARVVFAAADMGGYHGTVLSQYPTGQRTEDSMGVLRAAAQPAEGVKPTGYTMPHTLEVTNPSYGDGFYTNEIYLVGTSDPNEPLYIDGQEVRTRTESGVFGVLVAMEEGENTWVLTNGSQSVEYLAKYHTGSAGGDGAAATPPVYETREAEENEGIRINFQFASAFEEWADTVIPNEMFYENAVAKVENVLLRNDAPYAYQITGGDWVYAYTTVDKETVLLSEPFAWQDIAFTGLSAREANGGEYIDFVGGGTPAAYVAYKAETNALEITMFDTSFSVDEGFSSRLVQSASVRKDEDNGGTVLVLQLNEIWGYQLEYTDGGTTLYLKDPVPVSTDATKPLEGLTIMLDPGHGDHDYGAWAVIVGKQSSLDGPYEKTLVLDIAQATAYRLRQLGAEVVMTRDDDTFVGLYERLALQSDDKPDMFISFHTNALDPYTDLSETGGTEVYYYHPYPVANSAGLAENLVNSLVNTTGFKNRKAKWATYLVTRTTVCPSVLCEFGFLGNPYEFENMTSQEAIYNQADAVVEGILATVRGETIAWVGEEADAG